VPASGMHDKSTYWLDSSGPDKRRIVSVRELTPKQTEQEMLALLQQAEREGLHVEATMADGSKLTGAVTLLETCKPYHVIPSGLIRVSIDEHGASFGATFDSQRIVAVKVEEKTHITPTCCADVAPYIGRRVRVDDGIEGILTGCGIDPDDVLDAACWFGLDGECPVYEGDKEQVKCYAFTADEGYWTFELLPDEPAPGNLMIEPKVPADLEPYIGRRVRVLAGPERELVREGVLVDSSWQGCPAVVLEGRPIGWRFGEGSGRSTLVEVLPELPEAEDDDTSMEDDNDDAVSAGYIPGEPVLSFGTVQMQVDGEPALVTIGADGTLTARDGRRLCLTTEGDAITAPRIVSKLTLAELLAMAPDGVHGTAYAAFHHTVREAIAAGLVHD
jgi:hypothetical protein